MLACAYLPLVLALAADPADLDEKMLAAAGHKTDGPALLAFVQKRIPTDKERDRLAGLVRQLGADSFEAREKAHEGLVAAGPLALPVLRPALSSPDLEVRRRAARCQEQIEREPHAQHLAAVLRLIAVRKPAGAAKVLLEYVASAEAEGPSEEVLEALAVVGLKAGAPESVVRTALSAQSAAQRAAAASVVGKSALAHRKLLVPLLRDSAPLVRLHAARGLVTGGQKRGVPVLIALLGEGPQDLALHAEELLLSAAGDSAPPVAWGPDAAKRKAARTAWEKWWDAKGDALDLSKVKFEDAPLGLTVVCGFENHGAGPGHVCALGPDGKDRWHITGMDSAADVQLLPGGRVLVAEHWPQKVTERDRTGKVLWEKALASKPVSCQRLPGGNTFIATYDGLLEVTPEGKEVYSIRTPDGWIYCARKLRDGGIVSINQSGLVREYDRDRKEVRSFRPAAHSEGAGWWASVEPLPGGKYLLALGSSNKVVETDATGKILWEASVSGSPGWATRLRNGHTLVAGMQDKNIVELDAAGKEVWKATVPCRPFRARRY